MKINQKLVTEKSTKYIVSSCTVCGSRKLRYAFLLKEHRIVRCDDCGLMFVNPQPSDDTVNRIYGSEYFFLSSDEDGRCHVETLKKSTADTYLDILIGDKHPNSETLLEIGCGNGDFLSRAASRGLKVTGVEYSKHACIEARKKLQEYRSEIIHGEIADLASSNSHFDYIVFFDVLEHVRNPRAFLNIVFNLLKPNGCIFCVVPSLDSWSAKLLKANWMEFKLEHLFYFDTKNLRSLLFQSGFSEFKNFPAKKTLSIAYIASHFDRHPVPFWSRIVKLARLILSRSLSRRTFAVNPGEIGMIAKKNLTFGNHCLSVIMPAYNEASTIQKGIEKVLNKQLQNIDIELIIVESNSTDGTKKIVNQYQDYPRVKIIFEQEPYGKGHAVRAGLKVATGDFILIQDADDEYDIEDYDALIEPLASGKEAFVLGSRHSRNSWKMREFRGEPMRTFLLNFGHWFFAFLINVLYGVWLRDPFTMYKVFRRDCIKDISLECNRFDFDNELLIKLIRKGFKPIEIPVCYRSRSFSEGKKIRIFADPCTWLRAIIKYRFIKV